MIIVHKKTNSKICCGLTWREFKCQCSYKECTSSMISKKLVDAYERLRDLTDVPFHITSGYRCPRHNASKQVKGAKLSRHKAGLAIDIAYNFDMKPKDFIELAEKCGFNYVKHYKTKKFFHLEV